MYGQGALGVVTPAEGVPVSWVHFYRSASVVSPAPAGMRAGAGGVSIGRFGWCDENGNVLNSRTAETDVLGLVVIQQGDWRRIFWDEVTLSWKIREGLNLTMMSGAPGFWVKFPGGSSWNARVYTSPLDGVPVAGQADGLEVTPWAVARPVGPGGLSLITTWNPGT